MLYAFSVFSEMYFFLLHLLLMWLPSVNQTSQCYTAYVSIWESQSTCVLPEWRPSEAAWADSSLLSPVPPESLRLSGAACPGEEAQPGPGAGPAVWGSADSDGAVCFLWEPGTPWGTLRPPWQPQCGWRFVPSRHLSYRRHCILQTRPAERRAGCARASDWQLRQRIDLCLSGVVGAAQWNLESYENRFQLWSGKICLPPFH